MPYSGTSHIFRRDAMKKPIAALVAVAIIVAAIIAWYFSHHSESGKDRIRISGNIEVTAVEVSFKIPGRVTERLVDEGAVVKAGQVIARLESEELANEVALRQADLQAMQAALDELLAGSRREEIAQAEAALSAVEAEAKRLADDFQRQDALFRREV